MPHRLPHDYLMQGILEQEETVALADFDSLL